VNADRVRTKLMSEDLMEQRAAARGMTVAEYLKDGNLLKREVKADDVAQAFAALAKARKTTAATVTVGVRTHETKLTTTPNTSSPRTTNPARFPMRPMRRRIVGRGAGVGRLAFERRCCFREPIDAI